MTRPDFWSRELARLIEYVTANARLDKPGKDGKTPRAHYAGSARRLREQGQYDARAMAQAEELEEILAGPECPPAMKYLLDWLDELYGRSGATMDGLAPLSWPSIESWARMTRRSPLYHEIMALMLMDSIRRDPPPENKTDG